MADKEHREYRLFGGYYEKALLIKSRINITKRSGSGSLGEQNHKLSSGWPIKNLIVVHALDSSFLRSKDFIHVIHQSLIVQV